MLASYVICDNMAERMVKPKEERQEERPKPKPPQPAPVRVMQFVYDVNVGSEKYRVTLPEQLPLNQDGSLNAAAAKAKLHDLLLNNKLSRSGGAVRADVQLLEPSDRTAEYNRGPQNMRLDVFRDKYLGKTYKGGEYVDNPDVRLALASKNEKGG